LPNLKGRTAAVARQFTLEKMIDAYEAHYLSFSERRPIEAAA
jgi:hypothetical protein